MLCPTFFAKDHLYIATTKRSYLTMPNTLNRYPYWRLVSSRILSERLWLSVALEKTVIDSSGLKTCVHTNDAKAISEKSPGFELYSRDNCEINMVQQVRSWSLDTYWTHVTGSNWICGLCTDDASKPWKPHWVLSNTNPACLWTAEPAGEQRNCLCYVWKRWPLVQGWKRCWRRIAL